MMEYSIYVLQVLAKTLEQNVLKNQCGNFKINAMHFLRSNDEKCLSPNSKGENI